MVQKLFSWLDNTPWNKSEARQEFDNIYAYITGIAALPESAQAAEIIAARQGFNTLLDAMIRRIVTDTVINVPNDYATVQLALASLQNKWIEDGATVTIKVAAGTVENTAPITVNHPCGRQIEIIGADPVTTSIAGIGTITGSAGNWSVPVLVASTSGIAVNDYVIIKGTTGTGDHYSHWGCWKVLSIDSATQLTVQNTNHKASFPVATITAGSLTAIKTIFKFTGCLGFVVEPGNTLSKLDQCVLIGDVSNSTYGLVVGGFYAATTKNIVLPGAASIYLGTNFGVNGFKNSGIWAGYGGSVYAEGGNASCNNGDHGWEADCGGHIATGWTEEYTIANGNIGSGVTAYATGAIWAGNTVIACGNNQSGVCAQLSGSILMRVAYVNNNNVNGAYAINNGSIEFGDNCTANYNGSSGFNAQDNGNINLGSDNIASYNTVHGFFACTGGNIRGTGLIANNNTQMGFYVAAGTIIIPSGAVSNNNGGSGFGATNCGEISCSGANSHHNTQHGYWANAGGVINAPSSIANANTLSGYAADFKGIIIADSATASNNLSFGFHSYKGSQMSAKSSTSISNAADYRADKMSYIDANGAVGSPVFSPDINTVGNSNSIITSD